MRGKMLKHLFQIRSISFYNIQPISTGKSKNLVMGKDGSVTTIGINRANKRNSLDTDTIRELSEALDCFENDPTAKVVVIHGEGPNFCSGFDIDEVLERGYQTIFNEASLLRRFPLTWKPSVVGIGGYAVAEGLELAFLTDFRVIEETAVLGALGRRFGAPLAFCGSHMNHISSSAKKLFLAGHTIKGLQAKEMGITDRCIATGTALGQAVSQAMMVAKYPQNSLIYDKLSLLLHQLPVGCEQRLAIEDRMKMLWPEVVKEVEENLKKFKDGGIGKHGKSSGFGPKRTKDWEDEEERLAAKERSGPS